MKYRRIEFWKLFELNYNDFNDFANVNMKVMFEVNRGRSMRWGRNLTSNSRIIPDRLSLESLARQVLIISEVNLVVDS